MNKNIINYLIVLTAVSLSACASKQPPISAMTQAGVAVKRAEDAKAVEAAPLEMRLAREHLDQAQKNMDQKQYDAALRNAESATVQAELAESKAKLQETKSKTTDAQQGLQTLEKEIKHSNERGAK
jgi:septal ring factor EnvC (AmiA/AmiB activator)